MKWLFCQVNNVQVAMYSYFVVPLSCDCYVIVMWSRSGTGDKPQQFKVVGNGLPQEWVCGDSKLACQSHCLEVKSCTGGNRIKLQFKNIGEKWHIQWNLQMGDTLGLAILSFVERLSSSRMLEMNYFSKGVQKSFFVGRLSLSRRVL